MIRSAINRILELDEPHYYERNGEIFSDKQLHRLQEEHRAEAFRLSTLTGLVDYILDSKEKFKEIPYIVHIISPTEVRLMSTLDSDRKREYLAIVDAETPNIPFGTFIENEKMIITLQAMFQQDEKTDIKNVEKFAGTVASGTVKDYSDDGISQKATVKTGITTRAEGIVPSPCMLRPYRTFMEVQQPSSVFIFRMREGIKDSVESALFEADGGAWKNEAMANIKEYLQEKLKDTDVTVIS